MAFSNANILSLDSSATNITTAAYVQLSSSIPIGTCRLVIWNGTSSIIALGYGASSSEVGFVGIGPNMMTIVDVPTVKMMPSGTRLALIALDATASNGLVVVSLLP